MSYVDWKINVAEFQEPSEPIAASQTELDRIQKANSRIAKRLEEVEAQNKALQKEVHLKETENIRTKDRLAAEESARKRAEASLTAKAAQLTQIQNTAKTTDLRAAQALHVARTAENEKHQALTEMRQMEVKLDEERKKAVAAQNKYLIAERANANMQANLVQMDQRLRQAEALIENLESAASMVSQPVTASKTTYCPSCFATGYSGGKCPNCGKDNWNRSEQALPANTLLFDRFLIGEVLWQDDNYFVYATLDTRLNRRLSIKEYFPVKYVCRGSDNYTVVARTEHDEEVLWSMRRKLVSDNQLLSQINGVSGFATVYDILEVNDTFYVSFQKVDAPLHQYLDGPISFWTYRTFLQAARPFIAAFNYLEKHQLPIGSIGTSDVVVDHGQFLLLGISQHGFTKDVPDRFATLHGLILTICKSLSLTNEQLNCVNNIACSNISTFSEYYRNLCILQKKVDSQQASHIQGNANETAHIALTPQQSRAVKSESRQIVVVAGPGSGKTRVITERICYLANERNVPVGEILALSFTTKAANEMRKRLSGRILEGSTNLNVRTFHSFGLQILRTYGDLLGYQDDFGIISNTTKNKYLRDILGRLGIERREISAYGNAISRVKNSLPVDSASMPKLDDVFSQYENKLKESNLVDLDDMIHKALILLNDARVKKYYSGLFSHVMIDEFQDVNLPQIHMLQAIVGPKTNTFMVGDDDQCIYEWRGSKPQYISRYAKAGDRVELIKLEDNYRSEGPIVNLSSDFIQHNKNRIAKSLISKKRSPAQNESKVSQPQFLRFPSEVHQAEFFAKEILKLSNRYAYNNGDFAILVRSSKQADIIKEVLTNANIPYIDQQSGETGYDAFIQVLRTIRNINQKGNLARAVNYPTRTIDNILFADLKEQYNIQGMSTQEAFCYLNGTNDSFENSDLFRSRYQIICDLHSRCETMESSAIIKELLNYYEFERCSGLTEARNKLSYAHRLSEIAEEFEVTQTDGTLSSNIDDFLDYLEISLQDENSAEKFKSSVNIMTCHKAKGLEFPVVFIPGVQVGVFPNDYFIKTESQLEEERRLFYVTMTRAMDHLYVTCYDNPLFSIHPGSIVSKGFIAEIPNITLISNKQESLLTI